MGAFGEKLKKEREQRSITLDDIALSTKIGTRMLRALEEEKFEQLPGGIFNKGFVRAYARHVGLDEEQTISDYMAALGESQAKAVSTEVATLAIPEPRADPVRYAARDTEKKPAEIPWGLLALALLLVALALASWSYYHRTPEKNKSESVPTAESTSGSRGDAADLGAGLLPQKASNTGRAPTSPIPAKDERRTPSSPVAQAALHAAAPLRETTTPAGMFTVLVKGNDESEACWVSIVADGGSPVEATLIRPYEKVIQARNEVVVKVGSAGALDIFFNGRQLPSQGGYGVVRTLTFRPDGLQAPSPKLENPAASAR